MERSGGPNVIQLQNLKEGLTEFKYEIFFGVIYGYIFHSNLNINYSLISCFFIIYDQNLNIILTFN